MESPVTRYGLGDEVYGWDGKRWYHGKVKNIHPASNPVMYDVSLTSMRVNKKA